MHVYLLASLDTKGAEIAFVRRALADLDVSTVLMDVGVLGTPSTPPDVDRRAVFAAGGTAWEEVVERGDRGEAVAAASRGAACLVRQAFDRGELAGVLAIGGSAGTTIGTAAMRELPIGVPKLMVSTMASGQTRGWVGDKDILMLNSVVDLLGVNRVSRRVLTEAACAMAGMVRFGARITQSEPETGDRPLIAASMFGVTTPCVERAKQVLEQAGYEVLVFHATGSGGKAMESLIADGLIAGVLDVTTTELADEWVGGVLSAGPDRLTVAGRLGVPQVISVGALDMVNFGPPETVPPKHQGRLFYQHNPQVTLMRTSVDENRALGEEIGRKAAAAVGPTAVFLPLQGVSAIDQVGQPFDDPVARQALFDGVRRTIGQTELVEIDQPINNPAFADAVARRLLELMSVPAAPRRTP